jgi:methylated-DNA-[protein]-cysteine S-methyltransferase
MHCAVMDTPVGPLTVVSTAKGLSAIHFGSRLPAGSVIDETANCAVIEQLTEYFQRQRTAFDLPLDISGTPFQEQVWRALLEIPYGQTRSYGEIAKFIGKPGAARAVGMANHENPIAIVIPCHRVVGQDGTLTGYAGGLDLKRQLLSIERRTLFTS